MRLSSKRHGHIGVFYYKDPATCHTYALNGVTAAEKFNWMFKHITDRRSDINRGDLQLVADKDGMRMINRKTGCRMYVMKTPGKGRYQWFEEPPFITVDRLHERYEYNQ